MRAEATTEIARNLQKIQILQNDFNVKNKVRKTKVMNYNPVLARWKFEELKTGEEKSRFKKYETFQIETTLRERDRTAKSSVKYLIGEDDLVYNELFPDEPFDTVLERGLAYRKEHGSKETLREEAEIRGWKRITSLLADPETEIGTKAVVVSGPGLIEDSNYHDNFVDIYEASQDPNGQRYIKMTRFSSPLDYDQYWDKLRTVDANYFQDTNLPIDAWLLSHPLFMPATDKRSVDQIFDSIFEKRRESMSEEQFQKLLVLCMPVINYYLGVLTQERYDPQKIALSWNAVLQKNDIMRKRIKSGTDLPMEQTLFNGNIALEVNWLGRQIIETVAAGCGSSEGFDVGQFGVIDPIVKIQLSNSVAKFGYDLKKNNDKNAPETEVDEHGKLTFDCPNKNNQNPAKRCTPGVITRPPHVLLPSCPHCGASIKC